MVKWVTSVLSLVFPEKTPQQLSSIMNPASEELLQCHLNILKSVDGHIFVGKEPFKRKMKNNYDDPVPEDDSEINSRTDENN